MSSLAAKPCLPPVNKSPVGAVLPCDWLCLNLRCSGHPSPNISTFPAIASDRGGGYTINTRGRLPLREWRRAHWKDWKESRQYKMDDSQPIKSYLIPPELPYTSGANHSPSHLGSFASSGTADFSRLDGLIAIACGTIHQCIKEVPSYRAI